MSIVPAIGIHHHLTELSHPTAVGGYLSQRTPVAGADPVAGATISHFAPSVRN